MQYEDQLKLSTPEGVELELTLAGLGSRMSARMLDLILAGLLGIGLAVVIGLILSGIGAPADLAFATGGGFFFFALLGYDVYFEVFREGQTPGKRRLRVKVMSAEGGAVNARMSLARNALRLIDELGTLFIAGTIALVRSRRNQRLGDMAGGTVVVELDPSGGVPELTISLAALRVLEDAGAWDTSAVDDDDLHAARRLLERRRNLTGAHRGRLAGMIAERIRPKLVGPPDELDDEHLLEVVVALKARRGR